MKTHIVRFRPGQDLKESLEAFVAERKIQAGFIVTCAGGLEKLTIRMAGAQPDKQDIRTYEGDYEIVSLVGTFSADGPHLHISASDKDGKVVGGHLKGGTIVHPTAEIVVGEAEGTQLFRKPDEETGFDELVVEQ